MPTQTTDLIASFVLAADADLTRWFLAEASHGYYTERLQ